MVDNVVLVVAETTTTTALRVCLTTDAERGRRTWDHTRTHTHSLTFAYYVSLGVCVSTVCTFLILVTHFYILLYPLSTKGKTTDPITTNELYLLTPVAPV